MRAKLGVTGSSSIARRSLLVYCVLREALGLRGWSPGRGGQASWEEPCGHREAIELQRGWGGGSLHWSRGHWVQLLGSQTAGEGPWVLLPHNQCWSGGHVPFSEEEAGKL